MYDSAERDLRDRLSQMVKRGRNRFGNYRKFGAQVGVSPTTLSRIAGRRLVPSILVVRRIALGLGTTFCVGQAE